MTVMGDDLLMNWRGTDDGRLWGWSMPSRDRRRRRRAGARRLSDDDLLAFSIAIAAFPFFPTNNDFLIRLASSSSSPRSLSLVRDWPRGYGVVIVSRPR